MMEFPGRAFACGLAALALAGCKPAERGYQGWVEGDFMFIGPEDSGRVTELAVAEGRQVKAGDFLFAVDSAVQAAEVEAAQAALDQARARLSRIEASQQRPEEIRVLEASRDQARAAMDFSTSEIARVRPLVEKGVSTRQQLDQAQANYDRDRAMFENINRQIEVARLSGRREDIDAARFAVEGAQASLANAQAKQARTRIMAQVDGRIEEVYYRQGEVAPQGRPVVSLLPPENVKVRFFVPQAVLPRISINGGVSISCDGCDAGLTGRVSFISQQAEFTPPVIYSLEERQKLAYKIEARPDQPGRLRVGQPVTVELVP
jgi:HlyD family secretion protein